MPKKPPTSGSIKKGETRNPKGSSAKARALAKVRRMTADDLADLTSLLLTGKPEDLARVMKDKNSTFMQVLTAKLLTQCFNKADARIYEIILGRVVGKSRESKSVELTGKDGSPLDLSVSRSSMTTEEKIARADALAAARKAVADD